MLDARFSHLYFCQSLYTLQRGLPATAGLLVYGWLWFSPHTDKSDMAQNFLQQLTALTVHGSLRQTAVASG